MKEIKTFELTQDERKAIWNCVQTINCKDIDCCDCPFAYNCGCMLKTLQEIADEY